ncbi:hypothetical protein [Streptomyces sp. NBC_01565]|uniref:hypothetical protein n=1 Tax=Streptomyces sp. NBC_01565 TaxID=2975881 RepID=UPI0022594D6C|nr:hypothetical protein [Streptomyces sp. NBC_01565]MCX4546653.1 hypothetical protein [Streptomyces sp. NBC_01565]
MTGVHPQPGAHTALVKAALAGAGVVFLVLALVLPARWAYIPAVVFLAASVVVGRRPRRRT